MSTKPPTLDVKETDFIKPTRAEWEQWCAVEKLSQDEAKKLLGVSYFSQFEGTLEDASAVVKTNRAEVMDLSLDNVTAMSSSSAYVKSKLKEIIRKRFTIDLKGKKYLLVQGRILLLRLDHPTWTIYPEPIKMDESEAIFRTTISSGDNVLAVAHGRATPESTKTLGSRFVEKAETASIGRCLALVGYGTDDSLDDGDYLSDSPQ